MLSLIQAILVAFLAGLCVKSVDWIDDEKKGRNPLKWPLAAVYGALIGLLISQSSVSTIMLGALFAQVFARKIDTHTHVLGFAIAMVSLLWLGFPQTDVPLFMFFAMLAFVDEIEFGGRLGWLTSHRMFLKAGAALMLAFGRYDYFLGIMAFDLGYMSFEWLAKRLRLR